MKAAAFILLTFLLASCTDDKPVTTVQADTSVQRSKQPITTPGANPYAPVDVSPLDISYFPTDYPILRMQGKSDAGPLARVLYSRPHRHGRTIFGNLLQYGQPWRLGANEATEIELFVPVSAGGRRIEKGRYMLYCIPEKDSWTIIFNSNTYSWGLTQDAQKDQQRITVPVTRNNPSVESFTMVFEKTASGADLLMAWDDLVARMPIDFTL